MRITSASLEACFGIADVFFAVDAVVAGVESELYTSETKSSFGHTVALAAISSVVAEADQIVAPEWSEAIPVKLLPYWLVKELRLAVLNAHVWASTMPPRSSPADGDGGDVL
jgi:hypothetical protein